MEEEKPKKLIGGCTGKGFLPGQCGNPKGHPKGQKNFASLLTRVGRWRTPKELVEKIRVQFPAIPANVHVELAEAIRVHVAALAGESWAFDRIHGKPQEQIEQKISLSRGLDDVSDDELDRRIAEGQARLAGSSAGEGTATLS